ncbi:hypothetical protein ZWY2020_045416 [Hordeum vulgare]|nr:hypothetical protein ZWY2020_045416 [Hordeum vulgare]
MEEARCPAAVIEEEFCLVDSPPSSPLGPPLSPSPPTPWADLPPPPPPPPDSLLQPLGDLRRRRRPHPVPVFARPPGPLPLFEILK